MNALKAIEQRAEQAAQNVMTRIDRVATCYAARVERNAASLKHDAGVALNANHESTANRRSALLHLRGQLSMLKSAVEDVQIELDKALGDADDESLMNAIIADLKSWS